MNAPLTDDDAVAAQIERLQAIRTLCASARRPELAADYARSALSVEAVRTPVPSTPRARKPPAARRPTKRPNPKRTPPNNPPLDRHLEHTP